MSQSGEWQQAFPRPPASFVDEEGRDVRITQPDVDPEPLVELYEGFDDASRAQGLPPRSTERIREWVADLLESGLNLVAEHDGAVVGHATLVPFDGVVELSIFVHPEYQSAGVGTRLLRHLLGLGQEHGVDRVWLAVERGNVPALSLYRSAGFEPAERHGGALEMERAL